MAHVRQSRPDYGLDFQGNGGSLNPAHMRQSRSDYVFGFQEKKNLKCLNWFPLRSAADLVVILEGSRACVDGPGGALIQDITASERRGNILKRFELFDSAY